MSKTVLEQKSEAPLISVLPDPEPGEVKPAPGRKTSEDPTWVCEADGIWRDTRNKKKWLYERPQIRGKFTFKALGTTNLGHARTELHRRVTLRQQGIEPTEQKPETPKGKTGGDVIRFYGADGYLDKRLNERPPDTKAAEAANCESLLPFWDEIEVDKIRDKTSDDFKLWRLKKMDLTDKQKADGRGCTMVDRELTTLTNAFRYSKRRDFIGVNPLVDHPKFQDPKKVKNCRLFMPDDADQLHERASHLFKHPKSVALGFEYILEAYTGLRTFEALMLGTTENGTVFGSLTEDGKYMRVWRCKGQHAVNPFVFVHEGLAALLKAHASWKAAKFPDSPLFFPSAKDPSKPVGPDSLAHALERLPGKKVRGHGARAWYVTVRRSWGKTDSTIAFEIGHTTGGTTLAKVYGGVPQNWLLGEGPKMAWLPSKQPLAWAEMIKRCWNFREDASVNP